MSRNLKPCSKPSVGNETRQTMCPARAQPENGTGVCQVMLRACAPSAKAQNTAAMREVKYAREKSARRAKRIAMQTAGVI